METHNGRESRDRRTWLRSPGVQNLLLLAALAVAAVMAWTIRRDPARPGFEVMPDMAHSVPFDSFAPNPVFADGKTLQPPPEGTIPRGSLPEHYEATPEDLIRAGEELTNPFDASDEDVVRRASRVYAAFCSHCHGLGGAGDGPVAMRGFPAPPSLLAPAAMALKDGAMYHIVTFGRGNMPAHAAQISRDDRWKVILHIRSLQSPKPPPAVAAQPAN